MNRRLSMLFVAAATTLTSPSVATAACSSDVPVVDKRAANITCTGVHPGMSVIVPSMKYGDLECAASFAFSDQYGQKYLTIPGSCYLDYSCLEDVVTEQLPPPLNEVKLPTCLLPSDSELEPHYKRSGPPIKDLAGKRVGSIVYAVNKDKVDFALVRVDKGVRVDPALPLYGGPVRYAAAPSTATETYVYGPAMLPATPNAVSGVLHSGPDFPHVVASLLGTGTRGASVMKPDGTAFGYLDGYFSFGGGYTVKPFGPAIARASRRTGLNLRLMTAKLS